MKKISNLFTVITLCVSFALSSCEKRSEDLIQDEKLTLLNSELKAINGNFAVKNLFTKSKLASNELTTPDDPTLPDKPLSFKKLCAVFSSDVAGAWAGTWAGGKIGGLAGTVTVPGMGTVSGAAVGATVGAVVVGGAASYAASDEVPDTTLINHALSNEAEPILGDVNQSAYDGHNRVLNSLILNNHGAEPSENPSQNSPFTNLTNLTNNELYIVNNYQSLINNTLNTFSSEVSVSNSKNFVKSTINDDNYLTTVSDNFFDGLNYLETKTDIIDYINSYKNYVINTSNLS